MTDADFREQLEFIRQGFAAQGMLHHLGVEIDAVGPGTATLSLAFRNEVAQQNGYFHGGAIGFLVDDATAAAAVTALRKGETLLTAEYKLNFIAPAAGERLICRAQVLRPGRTLVPVEARVFVVREGQETLCAVALASLAVRQAARLQHVAA